VSTLDMLNFANCTGVVSTRDMLNFATFELRIH
jgi:hypothetical protein